MVEVEEGRKDNSPYTIIYCSICVSCIPSDFSWSIFRRTCLSGLTLAISDFVSNSFRSGGLEFVILQWEVELFNLFKINWITTQLGKTQVL